MSADKKVAFDVPSRYLIPFVETEACVALSFESSFILCWFLKGVFVVIVVVIVFVVIVVVVVVIVVVVVFVVVVVVVVVIAVVVMVVKVQVTNAETKS